MQYCHVCLWETTSAIAKPMVPKIMLGHGVEAAATGTTIPLINALVTGGCPWGDTEPQLPSASVIGPGSLPYSPFEREAALKEKGKQNLWALSQAWRGKKLGQLFGEP